MWPIVITVWRIAYNTHCRAQYACTIMLVCRVVCVAHVIEGTIWFTRRIKRTSELSQDHCMQQCATVRERWDNVVSALDTMRHYFACATETSDTCEETGWRMRRVYIDGWVVLLWNFVFEGLYILFTRTIISVPLAREMFCFYIIKLLRHVIYSIFNLTEPYRFTICRVHNQLRWLWLYWCVNFMHLNV